MSMRMFDSDAAADEWPTPTEAFADAIGGGLIPVAIPVMIDDEVQLVTVPFSTSGRVGLTATSPDPDMRVRLAVGLAAVARTRVATALAEGPAAA